MTVEKKLLKIDLELKESLSLNNKLVKCQGCIKNLPLKKLKIILNISIVDKPSLNWQKKKTLFKFQTDIFHFFNF